MKLARYRTEKGAWKYAQEIKRHFPSVKVQTIILSDFRHGVLIITPTGQGAYAGKRPVRYGVMTAAQANIPNSEGL